MRNLYFIIVLFTCHSLYAEPQNTMRDTVPFDDIAKSHDKLMMSSGELHAIAGSKITKVILLSALTSATSDIDVYNIVEFLKAAEVIDSPPALFTNGLKDRIWEALIQTDSENFYLIIGNDSAYISSSKRYAFLKRD